MSIVVRCDACGKQFKVDEKFAGKNGKCRHCGHVLHVPADADPLGDLSGIEPAAATAQAPRPLAPAEASSSKGLGLGAWIGIGAGGVLVLVVLIILIVQLTRPAQPVIVERPAQPATRPASDRKLVAAVNTLRRPTPPTGSAWDVDIDKPGEPTAALMAKPFTVRLSSWPAQGVFNGCGFERAGLRSTRAVFGSALKPDAMRGEGSVQVWDMATGERVHSFSGDIDVKNPVFSAEGTMVAGGIVENGFTTGVRVVSLRDGRGMWEFRGDARRAVAFTTSSRLLTWGSNLVLWDVVAGKSVAKAPTGGAAEGSIGLSANGYLAAAVVDDSVVLIDLAAGKVAGKAKVPDGLIKHEGKTLHAGPPVFSPDGTLLAVAFSLADARGHRVGVWDVAYGRPQWNIEVRPDESKDLLEHGARLEWRPDGKAILCRGRIYSYPEGELICRALRPFASENMLNRGFADNDHLAITHGGHPEGIVAERVKIDYASRSLSAAGRPAPVEPVVLRATGMRTAFKDSPNYFASMLFLPDDKTLATGDGNGVVKLWDRSTWKERAELKTKETFVDRAEAIAASKDGKLAVAEFGAARIHLWDAASGSAVGKLMGRASFDLAFTPDGAGLLFHEVTFGETSLLQLPGGQHRLKLAAPPQTRVAISPDGRTVAQAGSSIDLLDSTTGQVIKALGAGAGVKGLAFTADGRYLLAAHGSQSATPGLECFDLQSFDRIWSQPRHGGVDAISIAADGRLAAASFMLSLVLLDPATGAHRGGFGQLGSGQKTCFSPDGKLLAVLVDGLVKVFEVEAILQGRAGKGPVKQ